jgi:hypothetical protein
MTPLRSAAVACLLTLPLALGAAGCGSSDDGGGGGGGGGASDAKSKSEDAAAKTAALGLVVGAEACFIDQQSYTACKKPAGINTPIGTGDGQASVTAATDAGYTVVARSKSGTTFKVVKDDSGSVARTCDKAGKGGCETGGTW